MSDLEEAGYVRRKRVREPWCYGRPSEEHVLSHKKRNHVGDIWVCPHCQQVWIAVLRPSLLDMIPHWSVKWKRMNRWRSKEWVRVWKMGQVR